MDPVFAALIEKAFAERRLVVLSGERSAELVYRGNGVAMTICRVTHAQVQTDSIPLERYVPPSRDTKLRLKPKRHTVTKTVIEPVEGNVFQITRKPVNDTARPYNGGGGDAA